MFTTFISSLQTEGLRHKILVTISAVILYRFGTSIPSPGINYHNIQRCIEQVNSGNSAQIYSLINFFSGGALLQLTVFSMGAMPYITSSIVIQLLTVIIPRFEQLKKEGQSGQTKMIQYARYLSIVLAVLQSTSIVVLAANGGLLQGCSFTVIEGSSIFSLFVIILVMTAGAALVMWLGELITERGIGNGISILVFAGITARFPSEVSSIFKGYSRLMFLSTCLVIAFIIIIVVFVEQGQRRILIQYAKPISNNRTLNEVYTYLPLKINQSGVIPVIFASSLIYIPHLIIQIIQKQNSNLDIGLFGRFITFYLTNPTNKIYIIVYFSLIIFFTYFYVSIVFNTEEYADEMKKCGGFIPGVRPGKSTASYLSSILNKITLPGSLYLGMIAILPNLLFQVTDSEQLQNIPFSGTAVLIMIGVGLDTVKQIESQLIQRNYEGFLK